MVAGHLREKRGIYQIVLQYNDKDGNRKEKSMSTKLPVKNNKKKAEKLLLEARRDFVPPDSPNENMRFVDYLDMWLAGIKPQVKINTYGSYQVNIKVIKAYFSKYNLTVTSITKKHILDFYKYLLEKRKVKVVTVKKYHLVLVMVFKRLIKNKIIETNPMADIEVPKIAKNEKFVGKFYSVSEVNKLLEIDMDYRLKFPLMMAVFYGFRRSEIVGLKWSAFDFDNDLFTVNHTVVPATVDGKQILCASDDTKNDKSHRTMPLVPEFKELLFKLKNQQEENKNIFGNCYNYEYDGYICVDDMGNLVKPDWITNTFRKILKNHNLRPIRLHDLRHTCASILLSRGYPLKEVQEWLGHSDYNTTANIYAHLDKSFKTNIANGLISTGMNLKAI